jgi:hypothetical protein
MPLLLGNSPNQVPTNGDLGDLAFQSSEAVMIEGGVVNAVIGATTPLAGSFTTLSATGGINNTVIGATTPLAGSFTTVSATGNATLGGNALSISGVAATYNFINSASGYLQIGSAGDTLIGAAPASTGRLRNGTATALSWTAAGVAVTGALSATEIITASKGITFPATQVASSDANTLDDYEEGTWTPNQGAGFTVGGTFSSVGSYTKIGRSVTVQAQFNGSTSLAINSTDAVICTNLPFATSVRSRGGAINIQHTAGIFTSTSNVNVYSCGTLSSNGTIYLAITYQI